MTSTRIAFVITELDVGGAERALVQLVLGLPRDAWEPRVYCLGPPGPLVKDLEDAAVPVHCFGARSLRSAPRVLWQLAARLQEFRPAVLQSFLFHANLLGRLAGWWAGVPVIISGIRVAEQRSKIYGWLDRWTNFLVDCNVCVSQGVADDCVRKVGLDPRKLVVIPNGVDIARYQSATPADRAAAGISTTGPLLLTIGRLESQKGIDVLLEAAARVILEIPEATFVIIGSGPDRERLEAQAARLGLIAHVQFLGQRTDVPTWLAACTALVLPSRWEGMPNVVLEAMATGRPVIATRVEGIVELVQEDVTGWTVPVGDPTALAKVICQAIRQDNLVRKYGISAQLAVAKSFTIPQIVQRYAKLYQELLTRHRQTARRKKSPDFS